MPNFHVANFIKYFLWLIPCLWLIFSFMLSILISKVLPNQNTWSYSLIIYTKYFKVLLSHLILYSKWTFVYGTWNGMNLLPQITLSHYHLLNRPSFSHCSWSLKLSFVSSSHLFVELILDLLFVPIVKYFP